jgi:electron transfer flavoprotein alpha subunit
MTVLVIAEHDNQNLKSSTLNTITAATKFSDEIHLIILGNGIDNLINSCQSLHEVSKILKCDHEKLENPLPEIMVPIISNISKNYTHILAPATTFGKNLLPRLSALLDVTQISDVIEIQNNKYFCQTYLCW